MRVATSQIYNIANLGMAKAQAAVTRTDEQIASNKRLLSPGDDPVATTKILQLTQELGRIEQFGKNIVIAENNLNLEEVALKSVVTMLERMKEIGVAAGNSAVLTTDDYKAYAAEVDSRLNELLDLQNTRNASGQYIFGGYQSGSQPFSSDGGGNYSYHGDEGQLYLQASSSVSVAVSDSGKKLFMDIPSGHNTFSTFAGIANSAVPPATVSVGEVVDQEAFDKFFPKDMVISFTDGGTKYSITERASGKSLVAGADYKPGEAIEVNGVNFSISGQPAEGDSFFVESSNKESLATTLSRFSEAMKHVKNTPESKAELQKMVDKTLVNIGNALTNVSSAQSEIGARMNTLESATNLNLDTKLYSTKVLGSLQDLDYAEASTRLQMETFVLSAAQSSFVKVSQLNLFSYL